MSIVENKHKRPILFRGEQLGRPGKSPNGFSADKVYPRTYEEALDFVKGELSDTVHDVSEMPTNIRTSEVVLTVKMAKGFLAKSYTPDMFFKHMNLVPVGSKVLMEDGVEKKLQFVRAKPSTLKEDIEQISKEEHSGFKTDLRKIDGLSVRNDVYDKVVGFDDSKDSEMLYDIEIILHAFSGDNRDEAVRKLQSFIGVDYPIRAKNYDSDGPTFVFVRLPIHIIQQLKDFNPLRTAHPFKFRMFENPYDKAVPATRMNLPSFATGNVEELPTVGIFDGGVSRSSEFMKPFVTKEIPLVDSISERAHGTLVAGTVIYGDLEDADNIRNVFPRAKVLSVRAFPETADQTSFDIIDGIERVVAANPDIDVFNISFGPDEPIDDEVTRFTYAIDRMAFKWHKLFVIAVGNSGQQADILKRIQSPSDAVNALGVGAFCRSKLNGLTRAPYSSIGPGREGAKIKPDILALGGSPEVPLNLIGELPNVIYKALGTSFAAPEVAAQAAILLANTDHQEIDFLAAKALLINGAKIQGDRASNENGWGFLIESSESLLTSDESSVTVVFSGSTFAKVYTNLRIPVPQNISAKSVRLTWTTVTLAEPDPNSSEAYTHVAVEETLYPDEDQLTASGNPKSKSANIFPKGVSETGRRKRYDWDTTVKHSRSVKPQNLKQPYLRIHAMTRDASEVEVDYAIALRIDVEHYDGDLYDDIRNEYKVLEPVQLSAQVQQNIQN